MLHVVCDILLGMWCFSFGLVCGVLYFVWHAVCDIWHGMWCVALDVACGVWHME